MSTADGALLVENSLSREGLRILRVMNSKPIDKGWLDYVPDFAGAEIKRWEDELHFHHLQAKWLAREVVWWTFQTVPFLVRRSAVLWHIDPGQRASQAILDGAAAYALNLGRDPRYAFLREMPKGADEGVDVSGVMLIRAAWMPAGFVMLDCGGDQAVPVYRIVEKVGQV